MSQSPRAKWSRPGVVDFQESPEKLLTFQIKTPAITANFATQGAHLIDFTPTNNKPLLFVSKQSFFTPGKAIRGGIPVIFPWFGPREGHPESPMHGLVRTRCWEISGIEVRADGSATVGFTFESTPETIALWPHAFRLSLSFVLGNNLEIHWEVQNSGDSPFRFEQALHPYFPVTDISKTSVHGLTGSYYIDKTDNLTLKQDHEDSVSFTAETDRLYLDTTTTCTIDDVAGGHRLVITKSGSSSSVVWNPWIAKAATLSDLHNDEWKTFVCVEQVNAAKNAIELAAGQTHIFKASFSPAQLTP